MLWEVQRKVTQLKRKLRHSKKHTPQSKQENEPVKRNDTPVAKHETDELITLLEATEAELLLEQEELSSIGNELRKRIETEKREIERLNDEIAALNASKEADQDLDLSGSDSDSSESKVEDSTELEKILQKLLEENKELQGKNTELCQSIHNERETCMELQVQIQMIERKKSRPTREKMPERTQEIKTEVSSKGPMIMSVTSV
ncbi:PREDICTED: ralA-binding protein 1-like [Acropora digitifera]|uniref:ralA-binding protein 1-like n=1 Tax=Acropora digitifera TaxID=70779 RepID=UPI00077A8693|nr:PREDICTED: ralA-binding protein 1-like [Acropora digitifera]